MSNKEKYKNNNHRLPDGTKNRKRSNRHKKVSQLEKDQQLSRDNRSLLRDQILPIYLKHNDIRAFHVLFIEDETKNNERVLLELTDLSNGMYSAELPIIDSEALKTDVNGIRKLLSEKFGILADNIYLDIDNKLVIAKKIKCSSSTLRSFVLRTYNFTTWFTGRMLIQIRNTAFYNNDLTDIYLASKEDLGNIVISTFLLRTILDYRVYSGKIEDYSSNIGTNKYRPGGSFDFHYALENLTEMEKLEKEKGELAYLLYGDPYVIGSKNTKPIVQDVDKFLRLKPKFDEFERRLAQLRKESKTTAEFVEEADKVVREEQLIFSRFYGKNERPK